MEEFDNEEEVDNELLDDEGRLDGTGTLVTVVAVAVPEPNDGPAVDVPPSAELTSWNLLFFRESLASKSKIGRNYETSKSHPKVVQTFLQYDRQCLRYFSTHLIIIDLFKPLGKLLAPIIVLHHVGQGELVAFDLVTKSRVQLGHCVQFLLGHLDGRGRGEMISSKTQKYFTNTNKKYLEICNKYKYLQLPVQ